MDTCNARIKPNLTPSLRHTIMSNLITVFLAACLMAHDLKKNKAHQSQKKATLLFSSFLPNPLAWRIKSQDGGNPFSIIAHSLYHDRFKFFNFLHAIFLYLYVLIPFPLILYVTPYAMCFFFSLDIIITQTNYVRVIFYIIIQQ